MCAWWCWTRTSGRPSVWRCGPLAGAVAGVPVGGEESRARPRSPSPDAPRPARTRAGSPDRPCRRCARTARRGVLRRGRSAFFRSPPAASAGCTGTGRAIGRGAYPRERRTQQRFPSLMRTTESSHGIWIGRSWVSQASARCASRATASSSSVTIGSPATLPLVMTSSRGPGRVTGQTEQQVVQRGVRQHDAQVGAAGGDGGRQHRRVRAGRRGRRRRSRTMGRTRPGEQGTLLGPTRTRSSMSSISRAIRAKGLSPRALRRRSRATASSSEASQARW